MSEPEKYTLTQVLEIVRTHAGALGNAGEALGATDGTDPEVLSLVGERALKASEALWAIENVASSREPALKAAWDMRSERDVYRALRTLPLLVLAIEAVATNPQGMLPAGARWVWCEYEARQIGKDLMAWVTAHEKSAPYEDQVQREEKIRHWAAAIAGEEFTGDIRISADWARTVAIQTFRPLGQLGLALEDRNFEHVEVGGCPRLDDEGVAIDIAFCAATHLKRLSRMIPPDELVWEWLTVRATLAMFHVLADRLAIASHSTRSPKWDFSEDGTIPEQAVLSALDVLMTSATATYGADGEWLS